MDEEKLTYIKYSKIKSFITFFKVIKYGFKITKDDSEDFPYLKRDIKWYDKYQRQILDGYNYAIIIAFPATIVLSNYLRNVRSIIPFPVLLIGTAFVMAYAPLGKAAIRPFNLNLKADRKEYRLTFFQIILGLLLFISAIVYVVVS
jgi:hypothetical protein